MSISDAVFILVFRGGILALFALMKLPLTQRPDTKMTDCSYRAGSTQEIVVFCKK
jgi:hypothetical protein